LPLAVYTFQYPWEEKTARSQNQLEEVFLADIETALPCGLRFLVANRPRLNQSNALKRILDRFDGRTSLGGK
jgi:hypothetical protein